MRKCPNCGADALPDRLMCADCHERIYGTKVSEKIRRQKQRKPRKSAGYVQLYHGGIVKKSTYNWLKKKDEDMGRFIMGFFGFCLLLAMLSRCSP